WRLAEDVDENVLRLANSEYSAPETTLVGAGGQEVWTFEAVGAGETTISLEYVRPWEEGVPAVDTFQLTVVVE
ncbi:MAG: protease inhibitor I42 family protein, partial [Chloroflexota bacterium]|nr:protease inhibitor I42 family protein [Chloroflexota bacterium]